ncbi:MAG TPA: hypothetical protein PK102_09830, partial [bacterium]|nr:hypothetical protein [bacterium]
MKKILKTLVVILFILFVAIGCDDEKTDPKVDDENLTDGEVTDDPNVLDKDENGEFITAGANNSNDKGEGDYGDSTNEEPGEEEDSGAEDDAEREIVESDIYKVEGTTIWVVNRYKGLIAIDMKDPKALKVVGKAPFEGIPGEMYLQEGRAYILVTGLNGKDLDDKEGYWGGRSMSKVIVVN